MSGAKPKAGLLKRPPSLNAITEHSNRENSIARKHQSLFNIAQISDHGMGRAQTSLWPH
jgi:hypothetical protein